jgi:alpha-glucoside transport system substrate-binding protein
MRTRGPLLIVLLAVVVLVVVGCSSSSTTTSTTGAATTGTSAQNLSGQTLEVAAVWTGEEQAKFQKVLDAFKQQTGVKTVFTPTGNDIATVLGTRIQGGNPPDVAFLPQPGLMKSLAGQGALQPLSDLVGTEMSANYAQVWKDLGTVNGKLYGLVYKAANKSTFWYNVKALSDAGVQPPKTWDELLTAAGTLQSSGVVPFSIGGADGWTLTDWFENVYLRAAGPQKYDQLTKLEIPWTDPSVTTALNDLAKIFGKPEWLAGGTNGALQADFPTSVTKAFTSPPQAAMVYEGDFVTSAITGQTQAKLGTDANFFDFPSINNSPSSAVVGGDTAVLMKNSEAGKAFMAYLATPQAAEVWAKEGGFLSPNKNVNPSVYPDEITRRAAAGIAGAQVVRFDMSDQAPPAFGGTPSKGEWKLLQDFLRNPSNVSGIQKQLQAAAAAAYGSSGSTTTSS